MRKLLILIPILAMTLPVLAGTTITYQGQLQENSQPFNGTVDMEFELFDGEPGDNPVSVAGPIALAGVSVSDGLFQVELDFGDAPYEEGLRLRITVDGDELSPWQPVTAAPLAVRSLSGGGGSGSAWTATPDGIIYSDGQVRVGASGSSSRTFVVRSLAGEDPFMVFTSDGSGVIHGRDNGGVTIGLGTTASVPDQGLRVAGRTELDSPMTVSGSDSLGVLRVNADSESRGIDVGINNLSAFTVRRNRGVSIGGPIGPEDDLAPSRGLRVVGMTQLDSSVVVDGNVNAEQDVHAGRFLSFVSGDSGSNDLCTFSVGASNFVSTCGSSARYKNNIEPLSEAIELVNQMRAVSFRWERSGEKDIGLVAEEVAEIDPRLATYDHSGNIEGVKYRHLTAVLVRAVQELQADTASELAARDAKIAALQSKLDTQRRETAERLAALEALLLDGAGIAAK